MRSLLLLLACAACATAGKPKPDFGELNESLRKATLSMDNAATLALWEDEGVSLLPGTEPIAGKTAIGAFFDKVTSQLKGAQMDSFELACHDPRADGDEGSEWCTEHQHVTFADGQPAFDGAGKMLLVLHRGADGKWRIVREMWNAK
jgi:ketosteroid isomerase-like protein